MKRSALLLPLALMASVACHKSAEPSREQSSKAATQAGKSPRIFSNGVSPQIVSLLPKTITIHDGHFSAAPFLLEYDIAGIDKVTNARVLVSAPGYGQLLSIDLPLQQHGTVDLSIGSPEADLGPRVRLRVRCPAGISEWYTMGDDWSRQSSNPLQIANISPQYVLRSNSSQAATPITLVIYGQRIAQGCGADAEVNDEPVDLQNVVAMPHQLRAVLMSDALKNRPVVARYLEVKLQVSGIDVSVEDVQRIMFDES